MKWSKNNAKGIGQSGNHGHILNRLEQNPALIFGIFLVIQCMLIVYSNFKLSITHIDSDMAMAYVHAIEMWRSGSFLVPGWKYTTTLELDMPTILAVPIYGITKDIFFSFAVSNLIFLGILIWTIFTLLENKPLIYPLVCSNLVCIPYRGGWLDYFNMMFFNCSQYIIPVTIPLMLISLLVHREIQFETKRKKCMRVVFTILYFGLLLLSIFSRGIYVFACALFPMLLADQIWELSQRRKLHVNWISCVTILITGVGMVLQMLSGVEAKGNGMTLCSIDGELQSNIAACFLGIFELFGGASYGNVPVMCAGGINILIRMGLVAVVLWCGVIALKRIWRKQSDYLTAMLLSVSVWNTFVLCICDTRYGSYTFEYRYHLVGMIPLLCVVGIMFCDWYKNSDKWLRKRELLSIILIFIYLSATSWIKIFSEETVIEHYQAMSEWLKEEDLHTAYFLNDLRQAQICRLIDTENTVYMTVMEETGVVTVNGYYARYDEGKIDFDGSVLIVDNSSFGDEMELFGHQYKFVNQFGVLSIYQ